MGDGQQVLPRETDVIVIGAGVTGCSIAYQLAKRGKRVVVLEKRGICSGASGRNGGMTGAGSSIHSRAGRAVHALTNENLRMLREDLPRELHDDFSLRLPGTLDIALTTEQYEHLREGVELQHQHGIAAEWLDPAQVRERVPVVSDKILGAEFSPGHGHLWPFHLVLALADGARRYGATVLTYTPATAILRTAGAVSGVETPFGDIKAATVVVATNAWAPELLPDLPAGSVVPARGQILVTQPLPAVLPHPFGSNFEKEYGRQTPTGHIVCGGFRRLDVNEGLGGYEEEVTPPVLRGIASFLADLFPGIEHLQMLRAWSGIMGFTADGLPLIGPYGEGGGLFVASGFNGGGFSWAAATGKAVAQLISQGVAAFDLEPFDPNRFARDGVAWDNPYTAGEQNNPHRLASHAEA